MSNMFCKQKRFVTLHFIQYEQIYMSFINLNFKNTQSCFKVLSVHVTVPVFYIVYYGLLDCTFNEYPEWNVLQFTLWSM